MRRVAAVLVSVLLAGVIGWACVEEFRLDLRHAAARATVVGVQDGKWIGSVDVRFVTRQGRTVQTSVDQVWLLGPPDYRPGEQLAVQYDPAHPERARIEGSSTFVSTVVLFGGLLAVVVVREARRRRRSA